MSSASQFKASGAAIRKGVINASGSGSVTGFSAGSNGTGYGAGGGAGGACASGTSGNGDMSLSMHDKYNVSF